MYVYMNSIHFAMGWNMANVKAPLEAVRAKVRAHYKDPEDRMWFEWEALAGYIGSLQADRRRKLGQLI